MADPSPRPALCETCAEKMIAASELPGWVKALTVIGVRCADVIRDGACSDCGEFTELVLSILDEEGIDEEGVTTASHTGKSTA